MIENFRINSWGGNWRRDWQDDIITIPKEEDDKPEYVCSYCQRKPVRLTDSSGNNESYYCNNCNVEIFPDIEDMRKKSKLVTPNRNTETLVSTKTLDVQYSKDKVKIQHTPEPKGTVAKLK